MFQSVNNDKFELNYVRNI